MPIYTVRNNLTGEVKDITIKIAAREQYLSDNPDCEFIITQAPSIGDSVRLGIKRPDNAWKEVLQKIDARTPGSTLKDNSRYL